MYYKVFRLFTSNTLIFTRNLTTVSLYISRIRLLLSLLLFTFRLLYLIIFIHMYKVIILNTLILQGINTVNLMYQWLHTVRLITRNYTYYCLFTTVSPMLQDIYYCKSLLPLLYLYLTVTYKEYYYCYPYYYISLLLSYKDITI